jgi:hypothetical protein
MKTDIQTLIYPYNCGCETWFLTSREKCRLKLYEDRMMMRKFGPRSEEIVEGYRKLCNEKQCGFYKTRCGFYSLQNVIKMNKSRKIGCTRHVECIEGTANKNILFVGKNIG